MLSIEIGNILPPNPVHGWKLPPVPDNRYEALSNLLPSLTDFQSALCPSSRTGLTKLNRALRDRQVARNPNSGWDRTQYSRIALAVDRGALFLCGADITSETISWLEARPQRDAHKLAAALQTFRPAKEDQSLDASVIGWLYLLGALDTICRGFRPLSDIDVAGLKPNAGLQDVTEWLAQRVAPDVTDDIRTLLATVSALQPAGEFFPNPVFGGLGPIRGSDGDWIAGDTLVELKCTVGPVKRDYVAQLLCYAALSRLPHNESRIPNFGRLGLMLPRQSAIVTGTIEDWLGAFGAPPAIGSLDAILDAFEPRWRTLS